METELIQKLNLNCDNCSHKFELDSSNIKTELLGGDVEWRYFSCPSCHLKFTTYIGDKYVERSLARRNHYRKVIRDELAKGENLSQSIYWQNQKADSEEAKVIEKRTRKLKKEWNIDEREREFVL